MKLNLAEKTGKVTGRIVGATKTAPGKTKNGLTHAKDQFLSGFNAGAQRTQ